MKCPRCTEDNPPDGRFCPGCGQRLAAACAGCGSELPARARFCGQCGAPVGGATGPAPRFASPESYTPEHLARKILTSRAALEGERKQVTVLFADLKGSTEMLADRDPEEARRLLDPILELMMEGVHRYEGTVNQVMGDGIMALFGAPLAHEDHAVRACHAALRMQESVKRYAERVGRAHGLALGIRVGLNSGEVVVRSIRSDLHMDYSAVGLTTHLAARMEQTAGIGRIQMTPDTLRLAEGFVEAISRGPVQVKGLTAPMEVFELVGLGPARRRLDVAAARGLAPFVGREAEMAVLTAALERVGTGRGQVAALGGEPGVGKSRLFWEFVRSPATAGWLVLESTSVSHGKATAYLPVIDLLRGYFHIGPHEEAGAIAERVSRRLTALGPGLGGGVPAVVSLLDLPVDDGAWQELAPPQRRQRILDTVQAIIREESRVQPVMVVVEDLQWIDSETQALLDALVPRLPALRVLLLVNYRPEYRLPWPLGPDCVEVRVEPLTPAGAEGLLDTLLGPDPGLAALKTLLAERTGRNPFFLEESVRTLVEIGALGGERGGYRLARALDVIQMPATVQAMLASRIDRLSPEDKWLLQSASVIGKDVPVALLQEIVAAGGEALDGPLGRLQAAEFLYETGAFPEREYTFKHALTLQVAYGSLLGEQRRALHGRIVEGIERLHPDRLGEHVERLAHHALAGERWDRAIAYARQAGSKAAHRSANREALRYFEQALAVLPSLPESLESRGLAVDLRLDIRTALFPLGELRRALDHLRDAERLATDLGDQRRLAQVSGFLSQGLSWVGQHERAIEAGQRLLEIGARTGDDALQVVARYRLGQFWLTVGQYRTACESLRRNLDVLRGDRQWSRCGLSALPAVLSRVSLVWALAEMGRFGEALPLAREGLDIAEAAGSDLDRINACFGLGVLHGRRGETAEAIPVLERGAALCRSAEIPALLSSVNLCLGSAYALSGRVDEAVALLDEADAHFASLGVAGSRSLFVFSRGEARLLAGRLDDAAALCAEALDLAGRHGERGWEAWALRLRADIAARAGRLGEAERDFARGLERALALEMRPLEARCRLGLAEALRAARAAEAGVQLRAAIVALEEMGMRRWLGPARALLGEP